MAPEQIDLLKQSAYRQVTERCKGSILIIVAWALSLLAVFALYLAYGVRQKLALAYRLDERSKLRLIADAGVKQAIFELTKESKLGYYGMDAPCSDNVYAFKDKAAGGGRFEVSYNYADEKRGMLKVRYGLADEEGKININTAERIVLNRLFQAAIGLNRKEAQDLAASIVDWRDKDSGLSIPLGSAEDREYRNLLYPYEAKDADFEILDELLLVNGMDERIFEKIKDYITIYGKGKVNANTASKAALVAIGLDETLAEKILSFRLGEDGELGTGDDNVFVARSVIVPRLSQFSNLSGSELSRLTEVVNKYLTANSDNFMIKSVANLWYGISKRTTENRTKLSPKAIFLKGRKNTTEIRCVIDRSGKILYWRES